MILAVFGLFAIGALCSLMRSGGKPKIAFPPHETAVALGLLALPVPAFALALTVTHILKDHYVLALTLGGALVFVLTAHRLTSGNTTAGLVLAVLLVGIFVSHTLGRVKTTTLEGAGSVMTDARYPDLDILVSSGLDFAPAWYYAKPALRSRLIFTGDRAMAVRSLNNDQSNSSIPYEARFFHWRVETLDHLRLTHRRFLLNWTAEDSWLLPAYRDFGAKIELLDVNGDRYLFLVTDDHSGDTRSKPN